MLKTDIMEVEGTVVRGHGVASGTQSDPRYPMGTLTLQWPYFLEQGIPVDRLYRGTINLDIRPARIEIVEAAWYLEGIPWSSFIPPENFYFFDIALFRRGKEVPGLIYLPDPKTKTDHFQDAQMIEILAPFIQDLNYGDRLRVSIPSAQLRVIPHKVGEEK